MRLLPHTIKLRVRHTPQGKLYILADQVTGLSREFATLNEAADTLTLPDPTAMPLSRTYALHRLKQEAA
jgi:hypothetical protein